MSSSPRLSFAEAESVTASTTEAAAVVIRDALLAQAVQASADAVFCQDTHGIVITWNPAAERIYGYSAAEIVGRPAEELVPEITRDALRAAHRTALSGERVERFDSWHRLADGSLLPVSVSASPLHDEHGRVVAVATTVADISERVRLANELERAGLTLKRQNAELTRSNRDLEQFAYVASHDLSAPLRVITAYVEQLERRCLDVLDERGLRYMKHIVDASVRMRALIDDLLEFSQFLQAPQAAYEVDVTLVLDRVLRNLRVPLRAAAGTVEVGYLPSVWSDESQLESLLSNLVSNAIKFHLPGIPAQVTISAIESDGWVTLMVDDNGIGVAPHDRDRVFRMFQRLHAQESYAGTGIGLAIARQIVELHGGQIWIEDSSLGGARLCCTLPALAQVGRP